MELQLDLNKRYTYADYLTWIDDKQRELIDGFISLMTPEPRRIHQKISRNLSRRISNYLDKKPCEMYYLPFDVRFPENDEKSPEKIYTVVQPDLCIICDSSKLDERGCIGTPDMIIEITSENAKYDVENKFQLYQKFGVKEYWIIFPYERTINVFVLNSVGKYELIGMYAEDAKIPVHIFNGDLVIDLSEIFED